MLLVVFCFIYDIYLFLHMVFLYRKTSLYVFRKIMNTSGPTT